MTAKLGLRHLQPEASSGSVIGAKVHGLEPHFVAFAGHEQGAESKLEQPRHEPNQSPYRTPALQEGVA